MDLSDEQKIIAIMRECCLLHILPPVMAINRGSVQCHR